MILRLHWHVLVRVCSKSWQNGHSKLKKKKLFLAVGDDIFQQAALPQYSQCLEGSDICNHS